MIVVVPADRWACGHYRMIWPARAVHTVRRQVLLTGEDCQVGLVSRGPGRPSRANVPPGTQTLVCQRPTSGEVKQFLERLRGQGVCTVVDLDDDLWSVDLRNQAASAYDTRSIRTLESILAGVTTVTVSTPALAERVRQHRDGPITVIRNGIPKSWFRIGQTPYVNPGALAIAYPGSLGSHPGDVTSVSRALRRGIRAGDSLTLIGDEHAEIMSDVTGWPTHATGPVPLLEWPKTLMRNVGVGIAPLRKSRFNAAKSALKPLELSALGKPWIASGAPEYARLAREVAAAAGVPVELICPDISDWGGQNLIAKWRRSLHAMRDPELRAALGAAGRSVAAEHTIEGHKQEWAAAWTSQ